MREIFEGITKNEHISCVALADDVTEGDTQIGQTGMFVSGAQNEDPVYQKKNMPWSKIINYHLNGGSIGAVYDVKRPDQVSFFWVEDDGALMVQVVSLSELVRPGFVSIFAETNGYTKK